jgi:hypothetical protein
VAADGFEEAKPWSGLNTGQKKTRIILIVVGGVLFITGYKGH